MRRLVAILLALAGPALADRVEPGRVIRPQEVIAPGDVILREGPETGLPGLDAVIGQEARGALAK